MGRTDWPKWIVENCRVLSIYQLNRAMFFKLFPGTRRQVSWVDKQENIKSSVSLWLGEDYKSVQLTYEVSPRTEDAESEFVSYSVPILNMPCHYGGQRFFFVCPLTTDGRYCGRRVAKLYLPRGAKYFGCRHCYDLSYDSRQTSREGIVGLVRAVTKWAEFKGAPARGKRRNQEKEARILRNLDRAMSDVSKFRMKSRSKTS
jgi:hypothetical protein